MRELIKQLQELQKKLFNEREAVDKRLKEMEREGMILRARFTQRSTQIEEVQKVLEMLTERMKQEPLE